MRVVRDVQEAMSDTAQKTYKQITTAMVSRWASRVERWIRDEAGQSIQFLAELQKMTKRYYCVIKRTSNIATRREYEQLKKLMRKEEMRVRMGRAQREIAADMLRVLVKKERG